MPSVPVDIHPLAAWGVGNYSVTALELRNRSRKVIFLDPRCLEGRFHSAAFQHYRLGAAGTPEAVTVLYLVTKDGRKVRLQKHRREAEKMQIKSGILLKILVPVVVLVVTMIGVKSCGSQKSAQLQSGNTGPQR